MESGRILPSGGLEPSQLCCLVWLCAQCGARIGFQVAIYADDLLLTGMHHTEGRCWLANWMR